MIYRITQWDERYEVDERGHEWQPGKSKRKGALLFIRLKVHGRSQGTGWRKLLKRAGKARALQVFGLFAKLLEIAGDAERDERGFVSDDGGEDGLTFILSVPSKQVEFGLEVLTDIGWIESRPLPRSGKPRESRKSPANQPTNQHNTTKPPISPPKGDELFDQFWSVYPKKQGIDAARRAFAKRKPDKALLATMLAAIKAQKRCTDWTKEGGRYIPHPATWLNQGRWQDETSPSKIKKPKPLCACGCGQPGIDNVSHQWFASKTCRVKVLGW